LDIITNTIEVDKDGFIEQINLSSGKVYRDVAVRKIVVMVSKYNSFSK